MELESKVESLSEELRRGKSETNLHTKSFDNHIGPQKNSSTGGSLPKVPETHTLLGHRAPITSVAFNTIFSLLATSSEDASIKIWDIDSGELEKTLKGHTKSVTSICFSPKGNYLCMLVTK